MTENNGNVTNVPNMNAGSSSAAAPVGNTQTKTLPFSTDSYPEFEREVTEAYLASVNPYNIPSAKTIQNELISKINMELDALNAVKPRGSKWQTLRKLPPFIIAMIVTKLYPVRNIAFGGFAQEKNLDFLGMYQTTGSNKGTYYCSDSDLACLAKKFNASLTIKEVNEVIADLRESAPRVLPEKNKDLIPVNNGIVDYKTKKLKPFSPDHVFISKCHVDYMDHPVCPVIHNDEDGTDWDIESWMKTLFKEDDGRSELCWQVIGATIRYNVKFGKAVFFYSETGCNGKNCIISICENLVGSEAWVNIPIAKMSEKFGLESIIGKQAVLVGENDVGEYIDKAGNLKALATSDSLSIDRKNKTSITYTFTGQIIEALNGLPRVRDRSDSFYRKQLYIPFDVSFTGHDRTYIKDDYLQREEVLKYVLWRVINMPDYYKLDEPESCRLTLEDFRENSDAVLQFALEIIPECSWDLLPFTFLYDLFKSWYKENFNDDTGESRNMFIKELVIAVNNHPELGMKYVTNKKRKAWTGKKMSRPELLIAEYDLKNWYNRVYKSTTNIQQRCIPSDISESYRGLERTDESIAERAAAAKEKEEKEN